MVSISVNNESEKTWIVYRTDSDGNVCLISKGNSGGILPIGTFLTIEDGSKKFVLRVDKSIQEEKYKPSVFIVESNIDLPPQEQICKNIVLAQRVGETLMSDDDVASFIRPGLIARRSTQEEINEALQLEKEGVPVFLATSLFNRATVLKGLNGNLIVAKLPTDFFWHQAIIAGKTGSGKTNALKYLAQYFIEEMNGAVIAVNVKGKDLLYMHRPSKATDENVKREWKVISKHLNYFKFCNISDVIEHGIENNVIYVPYRKDCPPFLEFPPGMVKYITLSVDEIDPLALTGLMQHLTEIASSILPDIFRYWKQDEKQPGDKFKDFVTYFNAMISQTPVQLTGIDLAGNKIDYHNVSRSTLNNIGRELNLITKYFDAPENMAKCLKSYDLIQREKLSVLHLTDSIKFGSILLRDIVRKIKEHMQEDSSIPVLFIIDETHLFYSSNTEEALDDLSAICRTGRQYKTSIIFASQNPKDIPAELASVVSSKIFFQSEKKEASAFGLSVENVDIETLPKGYAVVKIKDQPHLRLIKFPKSLGGADVE
ncbi:MAG: DUF87 domain-containing protein [Candidatus Methanosuratincola petrocarbonis]